MRPHRLELTAFGAFPERVSLDLDALGAGGLVLLCGDTGSGKTTLLDALGFALFGQVPGERSKVKDLRSHHAADGVAPQVLLEFSARGRRWRVTRSPAWTRPGRATEVAARGLLEELVGVGATATTVRTWQRLDDIGHQVALLVGMSAAQFFQVVLLPQGRFATFLQAEHSEREKLLKRLFHVERFEHVEQWLRDRAASAAREEAGGRGVLDDLVSRVAEVEGVDLAEGEDTEVWATRLQAAAVADRADADTQTAALGVERTAAESALGALVDLAARQDRRRAARSRLAALEAAQPSADALRRAVADARRAAPVAGAVADLRTAEDAVRAASSRRDAARVLAGMQAAALSDAMAAAQHDLGGLDRLQAMARDAGVAETAAAAAAAAVSGCDARAEGFAAQLLGPLAASVEQATAAVVGAAAAAGSLPSWRERVAEALALADAAAEHTAAEESSASAMLALQAAAQRQAEAEAEERELRVRRVDAAATELAALLQDGTPCPVCGALEHPEPAEILVDDVTRGQERAAAERSAALRHEHELAVGAAAAAAERLRAAGGRLAGRPPPAAAGLRQLQDRADELASVAGGAEVAQRALDAARAAVARVEQETVRAAAERAAEERRRVEAEARAARLREELAGALGAESLVSRAERLRRLVGAARAVLAAEADLGGAELVAAAAGAGMVRLLGAAGFQDVAAAQAAQRAPGELEADDARVRRHDDELAAVRARLAEPDLAVDDTAPVNVDAAVARAEDAVKRHEAARDAGALLLDRVGKLAALLPRLTAAVAALGPLSARALELRALAELAAGRQGNRLQMPLATFVLAARLEEVAAAASARLGRMSAGRYALVHTDEGRDRRSRSGLALAVEDAWTGRRRDTATLSGGETFMTALALALGLADVVTAEARGSSIEVLFIDEGFGSLDPDSLDQVMTVLDDLRSGGRLVGLVSHVADLRQRVSAQVQVRKGRSGSDVVVHGV